MLRLMIFSKPERPWHHESLSYHVRRNRHRDALDPNTFPLDKLYEHRDGCGEVVQGEAKPILNAREKRWQPIK